MSHTLVVLWAGLAIGGVFGVIAQRIEFCLTGGLREWWTEGRPHRACAFILAVATALLGTQALAASGLVPLDESIYLQPGFSWLLVPAGGILFGFGMMLARGCGSRALVLLADGNLRSLLVLFCLGVAAYATLTGVLAPWRVALADATTVAPALPAPTLPGLFASWGAGPWVAHGFPAVLFAAALAAVALTRLGLRHATREIAGAIAIGALIPAAWIATGYFGADDFEPAPVTSLTFVAPIGETIQYLMLATGTRLEFGVAVVFGVLVGSVAASVTGRSFELRGFETPGQMLRAIAGGTLMGIGGALALGCSIGQGLSGFSTLAFPALLAVAGIFLGAFLAVRTRLEA